MLGGEKTFLTYIGAPLGERIPEPGAWAAAMSLPLAGWGGREGRG